MLLLQPQISPDPRFLFFVAVAAVTAVALFAAALIWVLLHRLYLRRVEDQKMLAMGQAAARILHQVKNPLQTVILQAELLREPVVAGDPAMREEACEAIVGEAERVTAMLNELALWASGSRRALHPQPVRLHDLIHTVARMESQEAGKQGIQLSTGPIAEATVLADPYYLRQALENLLRNAREAVAGQADPRVTLDLERAGQSAAIRVADNGPGIPRERISNIFQPFVSSKSKGMGLGLPICMEIIRAHGGRLEVRSDPGSGTVFHIMLPLHETLPGGSDARREH